MQYNDPKRFWGLKKRAWRDIIIILIVIIVAVFMGLQTKRAEANMPGGLIDGRDVQLLQCKVNLLQKDVDTFVKYH